MINKISNIIKFFFNETAVILPNNFHEKGLETLLKMSLPVGLVVGQSDRHPAESHKILYIYKYYKYYSYMERLYNER